MGSSCSMLGFDSPIRDMQVPVIKASAALRAVNIKLSSGYDRFANVAGRLCGL